MKIRTTKREVNGMLNWYNHQITQEFYGQPVTPAQEYRIQAFIENLRQQKLRTETNRIWEIPVEFTYEPPGINLEVRIKDDSNVLYLDFDERAY